MYRSFYLTVLTVRVARSDWLTSSNGGNDKDRSLFYEAKIQEACWDDEYEYCGLEISNGLISRRFSLEPTFGTIDWRVLDQDGNWRSMFRATSPEAAAVFLKNATRQVAIGALVTAVEEDNSTWSRRAYCNRTWFFEALRVDPGALAATGWRAVPVEAPYEWTPGARHSDPSIQWPPSGVRLEVDFGEEGGDTVATVSYEVYDGVPVLVKQVRIGEPTERVDVELLAANAEYGVYESGGSKAPGWDDDGSTSTGVSPKLHVKTDQAYGAACSWRSENADPGAAEALLNCSGTVVTTQKKNNSRLYVSYRVISIAMDSRDLERQTLIRHRVTMTLAPQTTEAPIFFHFAAAEKDDTFESFQRAVDQMVEVGFEMLIFSFGSSFDLERAYKNATYAAEIRRKVQYASDKGVEVGGYDLIVRDRGKNGYGGDVGDQWAVVGEDGSLTVDACIASGWFDALWDMLDFVLNATGLAALELDGPYAGVSCFSENHSHHIDIQDSVAAQAAYQNDMFLKLRARGIYVNQPDEYFYQGANRAAMGYSEDQFSLESWADLTISRQDMYDDLYDRLPTQGWMFAPISVYHGGGSQAAFDDKPDVYEWALAQYMGAGVAACYRGPHLFNASSPTGPRIEHILKKWVNFYKAHRLLLSKPVVHLRRPDAQSWDGFLHVHPQTSLNNSADVGLALLFNPTDRALTIHLNLPLYYTGLVTDALLRIDDRPPVRHLLNRDFSVSLQIHAPPRSIHTILISHPPPPPPGALSSS